MRRDFGGNRPPAFGGQSGLLFGKGFETADGQLFLEFDDAESAAPERPLKPPVKLRQTKTLDRRRVGGAVDLRIGSEAAHDFVEHVSEVGWRHFQRLVVDFAAFENFFPVKLKWTTEI